MASLQTRPMPETSARTFSIGVLVRRFNISAESLRNWERAGLIPQAHRTPGGHRRYGKDHMDAVHKLLYAPGALDLEDPGDAEDDAGMNAPYPGPTRTG
ncbi:MAG: MerR family DNA-binding transcriptional regulator [Phycisphaerales bacterium JB063]